MGLYCVSILLEQTIGENTERIWQTVSFTPDLNHAKFELAERIERIGKDTKLIEKHIYRMDCDDYS